MPTGTWIIIASGESLTQGDVDYCRGKGTVLVVNDNYRKAPWADVLFAADYRWWENHIVDIRKAFRGELWTRKKLAAQHFGINLMRSVKGNGICREPNMIHHSGNSGTMAIDFAIHRSAARIVLLGFDCRGMHWFGEHKWQDRDDLPHDRWIEAHEHIARTSDVPIINCTRDTALTCYPKQSLTEVL